jgi:hypothetical protein
LKAAAGFAPRDAPVVEVELINLDQLAARIAHTDTTLISVGETSIIAVNPGCSATHLRTISADLIRREHSVRIQ